jgi:glyoxylase-like metal-dependent hydrolase (beta-lactamase superfamily II)
MGELSRRGFKNRVRLEEENLISIVTSPSFAIGQQCYLVITKQGNLLWDCIPFLDEETIQTISSHGGIKAIAISHPHFYSTMNEWSTAFGNAPIYIHSSDRSWVMHPDDAIHFWSEDRITLMDDLTLIRLGGHFPGSTVARWSRTSDGKPVILSGDTIQVCMDRKTVSFMYSFPNYIPVSRFTVNHIVNSLSSDQYDRIYGGFEDRKITAKAKASVEASARRYIEHLERSSDTETSSR